MGLSDRIEAFIIALLQEEENEWLELKRNELASIFNCVPSQINYVITTRFSPQKGYEVESKRGGGGYLRIRRINTTEGNYAYEILAAAGDALSSAQARSYVSELARSEAIDERTARIMLSALGDNSIAVPQPDRDRLRANIFKNMLAALN